MRTYTLLLAVVVVAGTLPVTAQEKASVPDAPQPKWSGPAQSPQQSDSGQPGQLDEQVREPSKNHIFWVIPNYRADEQGPIEPLSSREKWKVAFDDSFDPSAFLVAGVFAGTSMAERQYSAFGGGAEGFAKYYGGAFADQAIGNFMTEGLFPILLRDDPRYFVKGKGGFWRRTKYAVSREFITRGDDGRNHFNTPELAGNAVAAGISNLYYPAQNRSLGNTAGKWGQQIGLDTFFNVAKEFWPDIRTKMFRQKPQEQ